jgi:hypothetical protein
MAKQRQALLPNDAARHLAARAEVNGLEAKVARNEAGVVLSDEQRLDQALGGPLDYLISHPESRCVPLTKPTAFR